MCTRARAREEMQHSVHASCGPYHTACTNAGQTDAQARSHGPQTAQLSPESLSRPHGRCRGLRDRLTELGRRPSSIAVPVTATTRAAERMAVSRCALCLAGAAMAVPSAEVLDEDGERRHHHHLGASRYVVVERASPVEGACGRMRESTRVADREEQTERAASGYAHAKGTDALKANA